MTNPLGFIELMRVRFGKERAIALNAGTVAKVVPPLFGSKKMFEVFVGTE